MININQHTQAFKSIADFVTTTIPAVLGDSPSDYDSLTRVNDVNPLHIIDSTIAGLEWRDEIYNLALQSFTLKYMAALPIVASDSYTVRLMKDVSKINPESPRFFETMGSLIATEGLSVKVTDGKHLPKFSKELVITKQEADDDDVVHTSEIKVAITLSNYVVSPSEIVDITNHNPSPSFVDTLFGWLDGADSLSDLLFQDKVYETRKKLIRAKNAAGYKELISRASNIDTHNISQHLKKSHDLSFGKYTNIFTVSDTTARAIETATGYKLTSKSNISRLLKYGNMMLLIVVSPDTEILKVYFSNGSRVELTKREAFKISKQDTDLQKILAQMSNSNIRY